jgi:hypothetical protein
MPAAAARYPGYGSRHGFSYLHDDLPVGQHKVCVIGIGANGGANGLIDCRTVTVK